MSGREFSVAVVGATGTVGRVMLEILAERKFPARQVFALASSRSAGEQLPFAERELAVQALDKFDFGGCDIAMFSAGASVSAEFAPKAAAAGCVVIDNTSQFRYDADVPLVVPEVNPDALAQRPRGIIANPNCSTIQLVAALKPLHDIANITRVDVATYQSVSGSGRAGIDALEQQSRLMLSGMPVEPTVYPQPIAFNVLPMSDDMRDDGYAREEMKLVWETRKILGDERIAVNPTCVRVPVFYGHSEAVHLETAQPVTLERAAAALAAAPGLRLVDWRQDGAVPTAALHAAGRDLVYVGRLRASLASPNGLSMWIVADNVRKGAALNSVQIAERLIDDGCL